MPNQCLNRVAIRHKDPAMMKRLLNAYGRGEVCREFLPIPSNVGNMFHARVCAWGTVSDFGEGDPGSSAEVIGDGVFKLEFHTEWTPPLGLYVELIKQGFEVEVRYCDLSAGFCGRVAAARIRHFKIWSTDFSKIKQRVDAALIEEFGLEDFYADYLDNDYGDDSEGVGRLWLTDMDLATYVSEEAEHYAAMVEAMEQFLAPLRWNS